MKSPKKAAIQAEILDIDALVFDDKNPREHTEENLQMLESSFTELGAARSIVIDEQGTILAGNGATEGARRAGKKRVLVIDADGEDLIAVRRKGLTPEEKQRLKIIDNRSGELSRWDYRQLQETLTELQASDAAMLESLGWSAAELDTFLNANFGAAFKPHDITDEHEEHLAATEGMYDLLTLKFDAEQSKLLATFDSEVEHGSDKTLQDKLVDLVKEALQA